MAVRDALLALLTAGPAYGFQLHGGLAARTGGRRTVNVGQTYATLDRLTRQPQLGLVPRRGRRFVSQHRLAQQHQPALPHGNA